MLQKIKPGWRFGAICVDEDVARIPGGGPLFQALLTGLGAIPDVAVPCIVFERYKLQSLQYLYHMSLLPS